MNIPIAGHCFRYIGPGRANGILQRVVLADAHEVVCVQESLLPNYSWLGTLEDFRKLFVFVAGPMPGHNRATGTQW